MFIYFFRIKTLCFAPSQTFQLTKRNKNCKILSTCSYKLKNFLQADIWFVRRLNHQKANNHAQ